jgi:hypothetical protein
MAYLVSILCSGEFGQQTKRHLNRCPWPGGRYHIIILNDEFINDIYVELRKLFAAFAFQELICGLLL